MNTADILSAFGPASPSANMVNFALYLKATGEIVQIGSCPVSALEVQGRGPDYGRVVIEPGVQAQTHRVDLQTLAVVPYTDEGQARRSAHPGRGFEWDPNTESWVDSRPLEQIATEILAALELRRETLLEGGFYWDGSYFHSDKADSQPRLLGLYGDALNGNYTPGGEWWKLKGGNWRLLSAEDAIAVWLTFKEYMRFLFGVFGNHEAVVGLLVEQGDIEGLRTYNLDWGWTPE